MSQNGALFYTVFNGFYVARSLRMKIVTYVLILFFFIPFYSYTQETISVCTDDDDWFPYIYLDADDESSVEGIVISLTSETLSQLGYQANFQALPWLRCMELLKRGGIDVVIAGTYTEERAKYAHFPSDAEKLTNSQYVLARDPFVVITHRNNNFVYRGSDSDLPVPLRAQHGYNITNELIESGINVKEYYSNQSALEELIRTQRGAVLINVMSANTLLSEPKYSEHLHYNSTPVRVIPYFVMFSKRTNKLSEQQRKLFYQSIKNWREHKKAHYRK